MRDDEAIPWGRDEFLSLLTDVGRRAYHDRHPFHRAMNAGGLTPDQVRGWVANRFHYQRHIPIRTRRSWPTARIHEVRRGWVRRLLVHDGTAPGEGGIEAWLRLGEAVGLGREETARRRHVLPGVRCGGRRLRRLAREEPWPVAVASSLTELFAPDLMAERIRPSSVLHMGPRLGPGLFPRPADPGAGRFGRGPGPDPGLVRHPVAPGASGLGPGREVPDPLGDARRHLRGLRSGACREGGCV